MEIITQTNRTVLFEQVNPEKLDLITLIGDTKGISSLSDEKVKEINEELVVKSFEEFLDKFQPVVYTFFNANNQKVIYTLEKPVNIPDNCITQIPLNMENDFLKMLVTLIDTKGANGTANVDFKFEDILEMISPKKVMDDIKMSRKEIQYLYNKYEELDDSDPKKLDMGDKLNYMFEQASQNYNNVMAMLPLAIEDIKTRLLLGSSEEKDGGDAFRAGVLNLGENGELRITEIPKTESTQLIAVDDKSNTGLIEVFQEDYQALNDNPSDYVQSLVVRTYCPLQSTMESSIDVGTEVGNYNSYLDFYKQTKDDFIRVVKPLIEKLLGVKVFFDQYKVKEKGMVPELLVTNIKLEMLVKASNLPRLITYLNTVNDKNDFRNTIWFGIVPSIALENADASKIKRVRFAGNQKVQKTDLNTLESLAMLLHTVQPYRISIFFSFQTGEETSFSDIATEGVDKFKEKCAPLMKQEYSEFAVTCIPNITVIPKDKSGLKIDNRMVLGENGSAVLSREKEDILKMWLEGVYVGAAFEAAGIVAAWQCPAYLRERFPNTSTEFPGVRFDIEAGSHALKATTTLAKEISGFTNAIKNAINNNNFGFVFSSENAQVDGRDVKKVTVYKARSLQMAEDEFEPIYKTLVTTYIERILRFSSNDFKQDNIKKFFSNNPSSQKSKWLAAKGFVNSILQEGDDLNVDVNDINNICNIEITFNNNVKNLKVEMTRKKIG